MGRRRRNRREASPDVRGYPWSDRRDRGRGQAPRACRRGGLAAQRHSGGLRWGVPEPRFLLERTAGLIVRAGLRVLVPERLPPKNGGISFGQAAVAAARDAGTG